MKKILVFTMAVCFGLTAIAQEKFTEGVIISKTSMSSDNEQMNAQLASMGEMSSITYVKDDKSRAEISNPMTGDIITISDLEAKEMLMIMGMQKMYMKQSLELSEEMLEKIDVKEGTETKNILGYECKQYIVNMNNEGVDMEMELFVTDQIQTVITQQTMMLGNKIDGFVMLMTMKMNQMGSEMTVSAEVTELKQQPVDDNLFSLTPPEGYTKMGGM